MGIAHLKKQFEVEISYTNSEHEGALRQARREFGDAFKQLEESHQEILRQEKCSYARKLQEIKLDMKKRETAAQTKSQGQIVELRKRCNEVDAEREELRLKYESQIKLTNKEHEER